MLTCVLNLKCNSVHTSDHTLDCLALSIAVVVSSSFVPGLTIHLTSSCQVFNEEKYLKEAAECAEVIWQRGLLRKGYGICHGTAGNGYAFLSLYKLTQEKKYLYRFCKVRTGVGLLLQEPDLNSSYKHSDLGCHDIRFSLHDYHDQKNVW